MISNIRKKLSNYHKSAPLIALASLLFICLVVFRRYLLLQYAYLFWDINDDSYVAFYPKLCHTFDYMAQYGLPKWSFKLGMGQNLLPYSFLDDPIMLIIYLVSKSNVAPLIIYVQVMEITLSGIMFFYYARLLKLSPYVSITGSLLYAFCGFITIGSPFFIFTFQAFNFALFLLAFEKLYTKKEWMLFPVAVALCCIGTPFSLFQYVLFFVLYALFRHLQSGKDKLASLGVLYLQLAALGIVGILLSGPFLIENIVQMLNSPRGSGLISYTNQLSSHPIFGLPDGLQAGTLISRLFSNDLLGSNSAYKGWYNYAEAPAFYCGLPCLLLLPQVFTFLSRKVRLAFMAMLLLWLLPAIFPYFRYSFWLFAGDYYRAYSLFLTVVFIYFSLQALHHILKEKRINKPVLLATLAISVLLVWFHPFIKQGLVHKRTMLFVIGMLVAYAAVLLQAGKIKNIGYVKYILFAMLVAELCFSVNITVNERGTFSMKALKSRAKIPYYDCSYNDYSVDAVKYIQSADSSFYRIDRSTFNSDVLNFSQIQGYNGTSNYNSFNQMYYVKYLISMGLVDKTNEMSSRWIQGLSYNPILEQENNVKYFLLLKSDTTRLSPVWDSVTTIADIRIFKNNSLLPFGYTYSHYIKESDFNKFPVKRKHQLTLKATMISDKDLNLLGNMAAYQNNDTAGETSETSMKNDIKELSKDTLSVTKFNDNYLAGNVNASQNEMMYLSIPFDAGWHLKVDGKKEDKIMINGGMTGVLLNKGSHTIELAYGLPGWNAGLLMSLSGIVIFAGLLFQYYRSKKRGLMPQNVAAH